MAIPKHVTDEMKRIMLRTAVQTAAIAVGVVILVLALIGIFSYEVTASPFTITLLIIGALMAVIGNSFVAHATTRFNARESILWVWGNRIQAVGFIVTLIAAFL
ncbi:MAG TPA: hypothetical protein PLZ58_00800 [Candidatus Saccharibacteria bacterium]|nr:hypothetical protein [Candidatus Saccharibacteria bacterium]HRQ07140.1 hypothetical protein [Candidatus Saccharibacteria bacterium]